MLSNTFHIISTFQKAHVCAKITSIRKKELYPWKMPTVLGHLLNQNIIVFGWEYLFCKPTRTIQQIVKTIWWYIYGSNYSFTGSCFMYIYTIYWLKQTLPLIKFVKISKISCFYFSMVLYFKTVYFPLISKIYIRKQTQGFDVAMGTILFWSRHCFCE